MNRVYVGFGAMLIVFYALTRVHIGVYLPLSVSIAQLILFPFAVLLLWNLRIGSFRVPRTLLILAFGGATLGAISAYGPPREQRGSFVVARFADDELETKSRIFREKIIESLLGSDVRVQRSYEAPASPAQAGELFRRDRSMRPLVWGSGGWLTIAFPEGLRTPASLVPVEEIHKFYGLRPVTYVSMVGMSLKPEGDSARFLALLFRGLIEGESAGEAGRESLALWERRMSYLQESSDMGHAWTTFVHRAYPLWQIGNYHLAQAFRGPKVQAAELRCAIWAFRVARRYIRGPSNLELSAALLNNEALARMILAKNGGNRREGKQVRPLLTSAMRSWQRAHVSQAELIAKSNLEALKTLQRKHHRGRSEKKKKKAAPAVKKRRLI